MSNEYVTIWSKSDNSQWMIERTHSMDYAKVIMCNVELREVITMPNGRHYAIFPENVNPNIIN